MYNKISSLILNSAKSAGLSDVFVAQPDSLRENLAGKVFLLAEIGAKPTEARRIFDFLIESLEENYYNDEKILLRGKIEGLKVENIFEAALTKINKNLTEFLAAEKIKLNPAETNLTLGVIHENKLHFANFGRNRALLIYRHGESYEVINVEANAAEETAPAARDEAAAPKSPKLFSSVISGEVPAGSYFIFASESLPEYLSGREMMAIVTKLPPITAAEQIKNVLSQINNYVPFLGIIIKNTEGLVSLEREEEEEDEKPSSAQSSISSLNHTEQKTEQMLAPAGLINFSQLTKRLRKSLRESIPAISLPKPARRPQPAAMPAERSEKASMKPDLGKVRSLGDAPVQSSSFLIQEKMFFKRKAHWFTGAFTRLRNALGGLASPQLWMNLGRNFRRWLSSLEPGSRSLMVMLALLVVVFVGSVGYTRWNSERQRSQEEFAALVAAIESQEIAIDARLLYDDEAGAARALIEAQAMLEDLPRARKEQQEKYEELLDRLKAKQQQVQKIVVVGDLEPVNDLAGMDVRHLLVAGERLLAFSPAEVFELTPASASTTRTQIAAASSLADPVYDGASLVYIRDGNRVIQYNPVTRSSLALNFNDQERLGDLAAYHVYQSNRAFYGLSPKDGQIYRFNRSASAFANGSGWLNSPQDFSLAQDLVVDGDIYVLGSDGQVQKFYLGEPVEYSSAAISPAMNGARKLLASASRLYIFDPSSQRVVVLDKAKGRLLSQYQLGGLERPTDFAVDEAKRQAYILDGDKLYQFELR